MSSRAKSATRSRREAGRIRRRRKKLLSRVYLGLAGVVIVGLIAFAASVAFRPAQGQAIPTQAATHVEPGEPHEPYNTDPPTSGPHYAESAEAGFYETPSEDEYLVHSLEHGYVIIWYDCEALSEAECADLKASVRQTVDDFGNFKVIGVPRDGMDAMLALTSWGQMEKLDAFDKARVAAFIRANRGHAPEPQGH